MNAFQFEAIWEELTAELAEVSSGSAPIEKYLDYLEKVGLHMNEVIRLDRRARPDGAGGTTHRGAKTWVEAHAVVV